MDDDSLDDPAPLTHPVTRDTEHRRRNEAQAELLLKAHARWRHAMHIEEALRRAGREREVDENTRWKGC